MKDSEIKMIGLLIALVIVMVVFLAYAPKSADPSVTKSDLMALEKRVQALESYNKYPPIKKK